MCPADPTIDVTWVDVRDLIVTEAQAAELRPCKHCTHRLVRRVAYLQSILEATA